MTAEVEAPPLPSPEPQVVRPLYFRPVRSLTAFQRKEEGDHVAGQDVVEPIPAAEAEEKVCFGRTNLKYFCLTTLLQEEGSDNEAVNELIGHYESDKPMDEAPEEPPAPVDQPPTAQPQEDEMQVDPEPVKEEEEEADEAPEVSGEATPAAEEADVEDSPEIEIQPSPPPEPGPSTRAEGMDDATTCHCSRR